MRPRDELIFARDELIFAKELWKLILEAEELVRNHYMKLAEQKYMTCTTRQATTNPFKTKAAAG